MLKSKPPLSHSPPFPSPLSLLISHSASEIASTTTPPIPASLLALPLEILHNLQYQHSWRDLKLHEITFDGILRDISNTTTTSRRPLRTDVDVEAEDTDGDLAPVTHFNTTPGDQTNNPPIYLLSGLPPRPVYIHPDLQTLLLKQGLKADEVLREQREWVLPLSLGMSEVTMRVLAGVFDGLPVRQGLCLGSRSGVMGHGEEGTTGDRENKAMTSERDGDTNEEAAEGNEEGLNGLGLSSTPSPINNGLSTAQVSNDDASPTTSTGGASNTTTATTTQTSAKRNDQPLKWQDPKRLLLALKAHDGKGGDSTVAYYVCLEGEVKPRQNG